jgi:hypothetical protein
VECSESPSWQATAAPPQLIIAVSRLSNVSLVLIFDLWHVLHKLRKFYSLCMLQSCDVGKWRNECVLCLWPRTGLSDVIEYTRACIRAYRYNGSFSNAFELDREVLNGRMGAASG